MRDAQVRSERGGWTVASELDRACDSGVGAYGIGRSTDWAPHGRDSRRGAKYTRRIR